MMPLSTLQPRPPDVNHYRSALLVLVAASLFACAPAESGPSLKAARGNEPFWAVVFDSTGDGATYRTPELPDGLRYREGRWKRQDTGWVYKARRERAEGLWLELEITEAPCTDSMSGESFPYKAVVTFEDKRMEGCAS
jgi:uncharacterized membrane protein